MVPASVVAQVVVQVVPLCIMAAAAAAVTMAAAAATMQVAQVVLHTPLALAVTFLPLLILRNTIAPVTV